VNAETRAYAALNGRDGVACELILATSTMDMRSSVCRLAMQFRLFGRRSTSTARWRRRCPLKGSWRLDSSLHPATLNSLLGCIPADGRGTSKQRVAWRCATTGSPALLPSCLFSIRWASAAGAARRGQFLLQVLLSHPHNPASARWTTTNRGPSGHSATVDIDHP
jgi:hypothetical protein